jgi:threonine/homoserine/homoserine lactone efflux protein
MDIPFLLRGLALGFAIAAPVGPIGVLCIRRTLAEGQLTGLATGLGAATADMTYAGIAAFGVASVSQLLVGQHTPIRLIGGGFLLCLGVRTFLTDPASQPPPIGSGGLLRAFGSTFLLTLSNPLTILSFAAVFAGVGVLSDVRDRAAAAWIVVGVFLGSALWWLILSGAVSVFRARINPGGMRWVNRGAGVLIAGFGALAVASVLRSAGTP